MFNVLLVIPPKIVEEREKSNLEFLGVGYLASVLDKECIRNDILDAYNYNLNVKDTVNKILEIKPDIVAISAPFAYELIQCVKIVCLLRKKGYTGHITIGGHAAVSCKEKLIEYVNINSLALGEGEETFGLLVNSIKNNDIDYNLSGYWFKKDKKIIKNSPSKLIENLDSLPFPKRNNIFTSESNIMVKHNGGNFAGIVTSRGCPYNCKFCDVKAFSNQSYGPPWRSRSSKNVVDEIEMMYKTYGITNFLFMDDNFIGSSKKGRQRVFEICDEIISRNLNISFSFESRVTDVEFILFSKLKQAGLDSVMLGIESGCQRMLDTWNKNITLKDSKKALNILLDLGINCHANFILYDMYSTLDEMEEVYNFMKETNIYKALKNPIYLFDNKLCVFPNTPLEDELSQKGILSDWLDVTLDKEGWKIFKFLQPIKFYEIKDEKMKSFIYFNDYWVDIMKNKIQYISSNKYYEKYSNWLKKLGYCYIKLFKQVIDGVRGSNKNLICDIDNTMKEYDRKILGDKFYNINNTPHKLKSI
ncbi:B12-binding domain-containing radical SAM protein [Dethiothermospora halolimnae]|uniref:B12-binding domain-containing radical SAM protein n=1 Tax=Dethiothermospora halolimnae TaxID=3114390 RepID=UPI003CCBCB60